MVPPSNSNQTDKNVTKIVPLFATVFALFESFIVRKEEEIGPESGRCVTTMVTPLQNTSKSPRHDDNVATLFATVCAIFESFIVRKEEETGPKSGEAGRRWCHLETIAETDQNITKRVPLSSQRLCTI